MYFVWRKGKPFSKPKYFDISKVQSTVRERWKEPLFSYMEWNRFEIKHIRAIEVTFVITKYLGLENGFPFLQTKYTVCFTQNI